MCRFMACNIMSYTYIKYATAFGFFMKKNPFLYCFPSHRQSQDSVNDLYTATYRSAVPIICKHVYITTHMDVIRKLKVSTSEMRSVY